jgi:ABC-type lipoprotein export system ATPase subunit
MNSLIRVENLAKAYPLPKGAYPVFSGLNFEVGQGEFVAIMGVSGVGKTTLLNLLGALDRPTAGKVFFEEIDVFAKDERDLAEFRNKKIGFIFQFYHLLPEFTVLENACMPLWIRGMDKKEAQDRCLQILKEVSLEEKASHRPAQLSGGEQQRVAIARALANEPKLLLADEPTGTLDAKTGEQVLRLLLEMHQRKGLSSIVVTHNEKVARLCHKQYLMSDGQLKLFSLL